MRSAALLGFLLIATPAFGQEISCGIRICSDLNPCDGGVECIKRTNDFNYCKLQGEDILTMKGHCSSAQLKSVVKSEINSLIEIALANEGLGAFLRKDIKKQLPELLRPIIEDLVKKFDLKGNLESSVKIRSRISSLLGAYLKDTSIGFKEFLGNVMTVLVEELDLKQRLLDIIEEKKDKIQMLADSAQSLAESMADKDAYDDLVDTLKLTDQMKDILKDPEIYGIVKVKVDLALKSYLDLDLKQRLVDMINSMSDKDLSEIFTNMSAMTASLQNYFSNMFNNELVNAMKAGNAKEVLLKFLTGKGDDVRMVVQGWITGTTKLPFSLNDIEFVQNIITTLADNQELAGKLLQGLMDNKEQLNKAIEWLRKNGRHIFDKIYSNQEEIKDMIKDRFGNVENIPDYLKKEGSSLIEKLKEFNNDNTKLIKEALEGSAKAKVALAKKLAVIILKNGDAVKMMKEFVNRHEKLVYKFISEILARIDKVNVGGSMTVQGNVNLGAIMRLVLANEEVTVDIVKKTLTDPMLGYQVVRALSGRRVDNNVLMKSLMPVFRKLDPETRKAITKMLIKSKTGVKPKTG